MTKTKTAKRRAANQRTKQRSGAGQAIQKRRPRAVRRKVVRLVSPSRTGGSLTASLARSVADPWTGSACVPDGSKGVGCFSVRGFTTLGTSATGSVQALGINLDPSNIRAQDATTTNTQFTFGAGSVWQADANLATIANMYARFRPVSGALRVRYIGNDNNCQGLMMIGQVPPTTPISTFNGLNTGGAAALMQTFQTASLKDTLEVRWRPEDNDDMGSFKTFFANQTLNTRLWTPYLFFCADKLAVAGAGQFVAEWILHFEGEFLQGLLQVGQTTEVMPAESGWYEKAMNALRYVPAIIANVSTVVGAGATMAQAAKQVPLLGWTGA